MSRCGVGKSRRFVFYDQIHTTGTDVKHKLDAVAAVTLGKENEETGIKEKIYSMVEAMQNQIS